MEENSEKIWKIQKKIVKRYGKYKVLLTVLWFHILYERLREQTRGGSRISSSGGGGALKKIAPSEGRRENFGDISPADL
jgi:hypothetical protein